GWGTRRGAVRRYRPDGGALRADRAALPRLVVRGPPASVGSLAAPLPLARPARRLAERTGVQPRSLFRAAARRPGAGRVADHRLDAADDDAARRALSRRATRCTKGDRLF